MAKFASVSGLKCNLDKTQARWMGIDVGRPPGDLNVPWINDTFSTLGITFCENPIRMSSVNYDKKIHDMQNIVKHLAHEGPVSNRKNNYS